MSCTPHGSSVRSTIDYQPEEDGQARTHTDPDRDILECNAKSDANGNTYEDAKRERPLSRFVCHEFSIAILMRPIEVLCPS